MTFHAASSTVANRGKPPVEFLRELVVWARGADDAIFAPNLNDDDIYVSVSRELGRTKEPVKRKAIMLEVLRVLAGFESSWRWNEGEDMHAARGRTPAEIEAGAWQVSADSMAFGHDLRELVRRRAGGTTARAFIAAMKTDHALAMEYIARLLRHTVRHNGPVLRREIHPHLMPMAVREFEQLLTQSQPA